MRQRKIDDELLLIMDKEGKSLKEIAARFQCSRPAVCKRLSRLKPAIEADEIFKNSDLSEQEKRFCLSKSEGKSNTAAAVDAYNVSTLDSAKTMGCRLMGNEEIRRTIQMLMDKHGLTRSYQVKKLKSFCDSRAPEIGLRALETSLKLNSSFPETVNKSINLNANVFDGGELPEDLAALITQIVER